MAVDIQPASNFAYGGIRELFAGPYFASEGYAIARTYDIHPDGDRFLMIKEDTRKHAAVAFNVVFNWTEELKPLAPAE